MLNILDQLEWKLFFLKMFVMTTNVRLLKFIMRGGTIQKKNQERPPHMHHTVPFLPQWLEDDLPEHPAF